MDYSTDIEKAYTILNEVNNVLLKRYITPHKGNVESTEEDFSLDVKSYLVLLHAAIEDYIERISVFSSNAACEKFKQEGIVTVPLIFLFAKINILKSEYQKRKLLRK